MVRTINKRILKRGLTHRPSRIIKDIERIYMADKIQVTNPFSGQSAMLTEEENKLYLSIKMAELTENYTFMQKQLDKFSRLNPPAFMTLLD